MRRLLWAWQRARRGWSDDDLWNLDRHILGILATALPEMARRSQGYPCRGATPPMSCDGCRCAEVWRRELKEVARACDGILSDELSPSDERGFTDKVGEWLGRNLWDLWL